MDPTTLAKALKQQDIYLATSENDPCSNALIEALACGLPAVFRDSGGHPELVGRGGIPFHSTDDLLSAIDTMSNNYRMYQEAIKISSLEKVADKYLSIML
jgi:glycosyltransferase involved in cell wall biosynthesis